MKRCPRCKEHKPVEDFNKDSNRKDGLHTVCRVCQNIQWGEYRLRKKRGCVGMGYGPRYLVIYDPLDSFTDNSTFTDNEIAEMLTSEYLAIGTRFRCGKHEYRVTEKMCLKVVERDKQRLGEIT